MRETIVGHHGRKPRSIPGRAKQTDEGRALRDASTPQVPRRADEHCRLVPTFARASRARIAVEGAKAAIILRV